MHYCCLVITNEFPTDEILEKVLDPFREGAENNPQFTWDWYEVGGRYNGLLKLKIDKTDKKYCWMRWDKDAPRNGRLFRSFLLTQIETLSDNSSVYFEDEFFPSMGSREKFLFVDAGYIPDLLNFENVDCYCVVDKNGTVYSRERWTGKGVEENDKFCEQLKNVKDSSKDCFACIVDLHI